MPLFNPLRWLGMLALLTTGAAGTAETRLEAEQYLANPEQTATNQLLPGKWDLWSKDTNAQAKWSGGTVLRSNPVAADRPATESSVLRFKLPVSGNRPVDVHAKIVRVVGVSCDDGKTWRKCGNGLIARRLQPRDGFVELQVADMYALPGNPGWSYLDYFVIVPNEEAARDNWDFESGSPGEPPANWRPIVKREKTGSVAAVLSPEAASGKMAVRITTTLEQDWTFANRSIFALRPGQRYRLSCQARNLTGQAINATFQLSGADANGKTIRYQLGGVKLRPKKDQWQEFSAVIRVPDDIAHGYLRLIGAGNGDFLVDDLQITEFTYPQVNGFAPQRIREKMDRGMIAWRTPRGSYLSWRLLPEDAPEQAFDLFRVDGGHEEQLNTAPLRQTTDFFAPAAPDNTVFRVKAAHSGTVLGETTLVSAVGPQSPYRRFALADPKTTIGKVGIGDLDGDGQYDFVVRSPRDNVDPSTAAWVRSTDNFTLTAFRADGKRLWERSLGPAIERGIWYAPYVVADVTGDGRAEVILKTGDGDPRDPDGKVTSGPEFLEVWDGLTGRTIARAPWPDREGMSTYSMCSRNQLAIAFLDGKTPCILALRGTYSLMKVDAWQLRDGKFESLWKYSSEGLPPEWQGQGAHTTRIADVDGDGRDEIILGNAVLDDTGAPLWTNGKKHPDYLYLAELPSGQLAVYTMQEMKQHERGGAALMDAATGRILWEREGSTVHVHYGFGGDFDPRHPGMEFGGTDTGGIYRTLGDNSWIYSSAGQELVRGKANPYFSRTVYFAYWDADLQRELVGPRMRKHRGGDTGGGFEGHFLAAADLYGDWREELLVAAPGELRIYSTTIPAMDRRVTLMADPFYRHGVTVFSQGYTYDAQPRRMLHADAPNCNLTFLPENNQLEVVLSAPRHVAAAGTLRLHCPGLQFDPAEIPVELPPGTQHFQTVKVTGQAPNLTPIRGVWALRDGRNLAVETLPGRLNAAPHLRGIVLEAEAFAAESGGQAVIRRDKNGVSGHAISHWDKRGHTLTWHFEVPQTGKYRLCLRYSASESARREIRIDDRNVLDAALSATGGYGDLPGEWQDWIAEHPINLSAGKHTLNLINTSGTAVNLDFIAFQ